MKSSVLTSFLKSNDFKPGWETVDSTSGYSPFVDATRERLESVLKEKGWSLRELGRQAGIHEAHAVKLAERGLARAGSETVLKIADVLGVNLRWLLTGEGPRDLPTSTQSTHYEPIERYHNRKVALDALSGEIHEKTRERIQSRAYASYSDPPVSHWIEQILAEEKRVRWELTHPEEAAAEATKQVDAMHREAEKAVEKTAAVLDPASGLRPLEGPPPPKQPKKKRESK